MALPKRHEVLDDVVLALLLLNLNRFTHWSGASFVNFEQVSGG